MRIKEKLSSRTFEFVFALVIMQPLLDVLSYFMQEAETTSVTTAIRLVLLIVVSLYGFYISDSKKTYFALYSVIAGFWILHAVNCFFNGYESPVLDVGEYLKLVQFPLWTVAFVTFLKKAGVLEYKIFNVLALNFAIIVLTVIISFLTKPVYTYEYPERNIYIGLLGFFGVPNSQSAIVAVLVPPLLAFAYKCGKVKGIPGLAVFSAACLFGFGLLYCTGTRFTYFAGIIIAACFLAVILISGKRLRNLIPLCLCLVLLIALKNVSPMQRRQDMSVDSNAIYQEKADTIMGEDKGFMLDGNAEIPDDVMHKIRRVYMEVYGKKGVYGNILLEDLINDFGVERVMKAYNYTTDASKLYNDREKKIKYLELNWEGKDILTRLLGFEYVECYSESGAIYDPENDFPPLKFYYGYIGAAMYALFTAFFIFYAIVKFMRNIKDFRHFLSVEFCACAISFALVLAAAAFSGQALRRPSLTVYFSISAAYLYNYVNSWSSPKRADILENDCINN